MSPFPFDNPSETPSPESAYQVHADVPNGAEAPGDSDDDVLPELLGTLPARDAAALVARLTGREAPPRPVPQVSEAEVRATTERRWPALAARLGIPAATELAREDAVARLLEVDSAGTVESASATVARTARAAVDAVARAVRTLGEFHAYRLVPEGVLTEDAGTEPVVPAVKVIPLRAFFTDDEVATRLPWAGPDMRLVRYVRPDRPDLADYSASLLVLDPGAKPETGLSLELRGPGGELARVDLSVDSPAGVLLGDPLPAAWDAELYPQMVLA
ncbi:MAG TPA: hypothetical protein VGO40_16185 [Longimicrobium sp.]|jgi:hypothetical protein|nr:hypothetical protein [Longimicrobium sp.]